MGTTEVDQVTAATLATIEQFNEAFNRHDVDGVMACMTKDCVFESTYPKPEGTRFEGAQAVRGFWEEFFPSKPHFEFEETFAAGERCVVRWVYRWIDKEGQPGHVRGVDIFQLHDGKVAEKLSYVKG